MSTNKISLEKEYDSYGSSDSETEYTENEKKLLKKVTKKQKQKSNEKKEIYAFDQPDESSDNDAVENSDFEEDNNYDGIPDSKAWGSKRSAYYNTDFVDQDYSTYNEKEEEQALQEEEEAKAIQQRLAKELDEADFSLDVFSADISNNNQELNKSSGKLKNIKLKTDLTDLSQRQKLQIFEKDSPEFAGLVEDFKKNIKECDELLHPIIEYAKLKNLNLPAFQFVENLNELSLNYTTNIAFYLLLKAKRIPVKNHPVVKRLVQMRKLLLQWNEKFENTIKPQLVIIKEKLESGEDIIIYDKEETRKRSSESDDIIKHKNGKYDDDLSGESNNEEGVNEDDDENEIERRGINYQIAKNKGLTPHRKKELRNPRVKHRNKFRKAVIRRKGAVRTVRKEDKRYSGEISGIKANVKKGIKIKS